MKIRISTASHPNAQYYYKEKLEKYDYTEKIEELSGMPILKTYIEINNLEELIQLCKEIGESIIVEPDYELPHGEVGESSLIIYDYYME